MKRLAKFLAALVASFRNLPGCSGPCNGGRTPCKCETGRKGGA
jgi:hypothetical protein